MKNTLNDLNNHLFAEIERLGEEDLKGDDLRSEIDRADAITKVSAQIINNGALALKAQVVKSDRLNADATMPEFLEDKHHE